MDGQTRPASCSVQPASCVKRLEPYGLLHSGRRERILPPCFYEACVSPGSKFLLMADYIQRLTFIKFDVKLFSHQHSQNNLPKSFILTFLMKHLVEHRKSKHLGCGQSKSFTTSRMLVGNQSIQKFNDMFLSTMSPITWTCPPPVLKHSPII